MTKPLLNINCYSESAEELFSYVVNDASIEWPADEDWHIDPEAKNLISGLLVQDPQERLGSQGKTAR
jgi:microtubule-associated serine/threonine kinase